MEIDETLPAGITNFNSYNFTVRKFFLALLVIAAFSADAQQLSNARQHFIRLTYDTLQLDTASIIPGSLYILNKGMLVDTSGYKVEYAEARLIWLKNDTLTDSLLVVYRVFPILFTREYAFRKKEEKM